MVIISSEPPRVPPEISGVPVGGLTSGEWLKVQCHLPWMNVKPALEFFINGEGVKHMVSQTRQHRRSVRIQVATSCNAAATNWSYSVMISISLIKVILGYI